MLLRAPYVGSALDERDQLRRERRQLEQERDQLLRERDQLQRERDQLQLVGAPSELDRSLYAFPPKHRPTIAYHGNLYTYLSTFANDRRFRILEIGSREVISASVWKASVPDCDYVGFDVLPGNNVDVVGDAHKLSDYFEPESFDAVIALAVFEHLAMPWVVAEEITRVLKPGGLVLIETHFSFNEHESPWHFFQFNKNGLESLFNPGLGFEVIDSGMDSPMVDASPSTRPSTSRANRSESSSATPRSSRERPHPRRSRPTRGEQATPISSRARCIRRTPVCQVTPVPTSSDAARKPSARRCLRPAFTRRR